MEPNQRQRKEDRRHGGESQVFHLTIKTLNDHGPVTLHYYGRVAAVQLCHAIHVSLGRLLAICQTKTNSLQARSAAIGHEIVDIEKQQAALLGRQ